MNKVVVILRDWLTDVDRDVLPAVRAGEKSLRDEYEKALTDELVSDAPFVAALLKPQSKKSALKSPTYRMTDGSLSKTLDGCCSLKL